MAEKMKFRLTEEIWKEGNMYVSYCPELDVSSCGETIQQAKKNLLETILINFEETQKMGTFERFLEECGIEQMDEGVFSRREEAWSVEHGAGCGEPSARSNGSKLPTPGSRLQATTFRPAAVFNQTIVCYFKAEVWNQQLIGLEP